jgi:sugar/nucleoside kinase (ribokinase family)
MVTPDSDRTMCTFLGVSGNLSDRELVVESLVDSEWFYTEGYLVTSPSARAASIEACRVAREAGVQTAISLSDPNMVTYFKEGLLEMIGDGVDLIFANEHEAMGLAGTTDLATAIEALKPLARNLAITRGPKGALLLHNGELIEIAGNKVEAVDTVGAGDMFAGAYLYGLTQGFGPRRAGDLASAASAKLVTSLGPRISREETQAVLARFV